jgi:glycosyltransferase involved in cell wall biosynthesis
VKPRVLFLDHVGVLGGGELSLLDIASAYRERSTVAILADGPFRDRLAGAGVRVEVLSGDPDLLALRRETTLASGRALRGLGRAVAQVARSGKGYDLLYANSQKAFVVAALAGVLCRRPVIWHLRDLLCEAHFSRTNVRLVVLLANRLCARVVANSEATARAFVARGGREGKVRVVHTGIDPTPFQLVSDAQARRTREELGVPGSAPLVGVFGRLHPWKGQHVALQALAQLPGVHGIIVGDALFGEGAYLQQLRERARALAIESRVQFLGFRADVPLLMRSVDVVLHTSAAPEPFGRVIVEGMLAGRPVIATRAGGALEIVEPGVSGLLVTPGDAEDLARSLGMLLGDARLREALGRGARERAERLFTAEAMVTGVARQIEEICGS